MQPTLAPERRQEKPKLTPDKATPKQRFQMISGAIAAHRDLIASPAFERAVDFAILEYERIMNERSADNLNLAASLHFKMSGVHEFLSILKKLSESTRGSYGVTDHNLDHNV